ncbi:MAG TPA: hypothetical protein PLI62_09165 [Spirochaetota bacterium]|nr:hypothetical protein [Spirochaetota bacterium]HQP48832.1 hypothetical protein [Spirochaetota bacterium]
MDLQAWEDDKYNSIFEATCKTLESRWEKEPGFNIEQLESILKSLYVREGNDWTGRGITADITLSATIAAHQHILVKMKNQTI